MGFEDESEEEDCGRDDSCHGSNVRSLPNKDDITDSISASTATIIRIPFVKDLANQADFLYATTDVAIWSTSETGIGITASCLATLRPLFREFFSRQKLMGGTSSNERPTASGGYIRSRSRGGIEEFGLRSDITKNSGTTTTVESGRPGDLERGEQQHTQFPWEDKD